MALEVDVTTPERVAFSTKDAEMVVVPGVLGEMGFLPDHTPLFSPLKVGSVEITAKGKTQLLAISGGFVEVSPKWVHILAETAELADKIDGERAQAAKGRAEERLASRSEEIDMARAQAALARATNRLKAAGLARGEMRLGSTISA